MSNNIPTRFVYLNIETKEIIMAAGDRNSKGKATDIVCHLDKHRVNGRRFAYCNTEGAGYITERIEDVTCLRCLKKHKKAIESIIKKHE